MDAEPVALPQPRTPAGRAGLAALVDRPDRSLVALDFDGTLSPIVADPTASRIAPGGLDALRALAGAVGRVAILTGRPAATVVELGGLDGVPRLLVEGQYGAEHWYQGRLEVPEPPAGLDAVRAALPAILSGADPGVHVEDKRLALGVHTRRAADPDGALAALAAPVGELARAHGLTVSPGRYVLEIRAPGEDKGRTLARLAADLGPAAVLYAGDDLGDLPAFDTVEALRRDGVDGLTVCSASREAPEVAARADLVVDGPAGVVAVLAGLAVAAGVTPA
ncbi:MAG TPA: trehalose-phosphatase [Mycobacteriales bacterium]|nr:trehalose-phosphatase [Mycobacteriales bacterium]